MLAPQAQTVPSDLRATLWTAPPMIALTEFRIPTSPGPWTSAGTRTRARLVEERPMPSLPPKLAPHVQTVPSDFFATVPRAPPRLETTSADMPDRGTASANRPKSVRVRQFIARSYVGWGC